MLNKVILAGRLTKNPEMSKTTSDVTVTKFTVAIDRKYQKDGERQADFINCVAFRKTAEFIHQWFAKGQAIIVVGQIQTRSWEAEDGQKRYATEVIVEEANFCGSKSDNKVSSDEQTVEATTDDEIKEILDGFQKISDDDTLPF